MIDRLLHRDAAALHALVDGGFGNAERGYGVFQDHSRAIQHHPTIAAGISILFGPSSPFAISGTIALLVVNSLKRMMRRAFSQISKEGLKGDPTVGHGNATQTIIGGIGRVWRENSVSHRLPSAVRPRSATAPCVAVRDIRLAPVASASVTYAGSKIATVNFAGSAAIAAAEPLRILSRQHGPLAKPHAAQVDEFSHGRTITQ